MNSEGVHMVEKLREALHKIADKANAALENPVQAKPMHCIDEIWKIAAAALILDILHDDLQIPGNEASPLGIEPRTQR
jgi:hypothetical protein